MDTKKSLKTALLLLIGIIVGGGIGSIVGFHYGMRSGSMLSSALDIELFSGPIQTVLSQGNCQAVREALEKHISLVNKYKDLPGTFFSGAVGYADLTLSYTRLARLERKSGSIAIAQDYLKKAKAACNKAEWKDCSEENILTVSRLFEKKSPIPCLKNYEELNNSAEQKIAPDG